MRFILQLIRRSILTFCFAAILLVFDSSASNAQETPLPPVPVQQQDTTSPPSAPQVPAAPPAPALVTFEITGSARSGKTTLPGVTVIAANTLTGKKYLAATNSEGKFSLTGLARGRYVVRIEFMGFAAFTQEVVLNPENPAAKVDAELLLASRQQEQSNNALAALVGTGRGFQSLAIENSLASLGGANGDGGAIGNSGGQNNADAGGLPLNGAGAEGPTESVSVSGAQGRTQDFGMGNEEDLQQRIQEFRDRMQREGGGAFGPPAGGGFGGGPGIVMMGRMPRGFNINQPHGVFYYTDDTSGFDARPYSLTGIPAAKADYNQARFGFNAGGPLNIPKIFHGGNKWFFFGGWNGSRGSNPYDAFSTVPTQLERNGDFSQATYHDGTPVQIFNPQTSQQYQFNNGSSTCAQPCPNVLDPAMITAQAQALLNYIPLPNMPTNAFGQNFHYVTSANSSSDAVMFRLVHNFNATSGPGGGGPFFTTGGGGGGGGRRRAQNNLNFGLNWARSNNSTVNPFPSEAGGTSTQGLNASAGWVYGKGRVTNNLRVNYNHNHVATTNLYSGATNVDGLAGIHGVSTDPFNWGLPGISFTSFGGLSDPTPRRELDQTYTLSDTISWNRAKHNFRFGADYRRILQSFHSARNGEGSFVFTGYATSQYTPAGSGSCPSTQPPQPCPMGDTGYDFADFLLGFPQQTSLQFGTTAYNFRANSYDLFVQDDWRFRANLSFNLGVRYEYNGPYTEAQNQVANLIVGSGFASAQLVVPAGAAVPVTTIPIIRSSNPSLINPDRNDWAPRVGIAWKAQKKTVVRAGYGINYNLAQYGAMIQNFAFQPPFANTATNATDVNALTAGSALTLSNGFPATTGAVTNNFAVNPNYRLGYVQIWTLDIQRELPGGIVLNTGYNGAKGTRLDIERALLIAGNQPFTYESSEGNSILHAASVRMRKRMAKGIGLSGQYVYSKSIDDASSIGGGGGVVAQNAFDISADRGLSSFDQRHKFTGNWIYDLPVGENRHFSPKGAWSHIFGAWQWSGDFTVGSGLFFTPRVLGGGLDISRGVSGSLRANIVPGQTIALSNPTALEWFNTAAFCAPSTACVNPNGTAFGDAGRNIIEGPGQVTLDMALNKTITIRESRALDLRFSANNVFNNVHFTSINTVVNNSLTFGEVTGTGSMRRVTMTARFRF